MSNEQQQISIVPLNMAFWRDDYWQMFNDSAANALTSHAQGRMTRKRALKYVEYVEAEFGKSYPETLVWVVMKAPIKYPDGGARVYNMEDYCGNVSLQSIDWHNGSAELAIFLKSEHHKKGIGYLVCSMVLSYGFTRLNLHRIWTGTRSVNTGMRKLATKLGMREEGCFVDAARVNGEWVDVIEFGILADEWQRRMDDGA